MNSSASGWKAKGRFLVAVAATVAAVLCGAPRDARAQPAPCVPACRPGEMCVSGMCMVPAPRAPAPPAAQPSATAPAATVEPPAPAAPAPEVTAPEAPAFVAEPLPQVDRRRARPLAPEDPGRERKGLLIMPFLGIHSFQNSGNDVVEAGLRLGGLLGGYVADQWSLNGSVIFDVLNPKVPPGVDANGQAFELAFSPLFHAGNSQFELAVGPKLGAWIMRFHGDDTTVLGDATTAKGGGWLIGGNLGLFVRTPSVSAGLLLSLDLRDTLKFCIEGGGVDQCQSSAPSDTLLGVALAFLL